MLKPRKGLVIEYRRDGQAYHALVAFCHSPTEVDLAVLVDGGEWVAVEKAQLVGEGEACYCFSLEAKKVREEPPPPVAPPADEQAVLPNPPSI